MKVQNDLHKLGNWSEDVNMSFNNLKFECLKSGFREELKHEYNYLTPDLDHIIEVKDNVKYPGVWMLGNGNYNGKQDYNKDETKDRVDIEILSNEYY